MVASLARHPEVTVPISGIGGVESWKDAVEFIYLGASTVQVCTAVMHYGYRIIEDMVEGLEGFMDDHGIQTIDEMVGRAIGNYVEWGELDLNYDIVAKIDAEKCIGCRLCHIACWDGAHQCIHVVPGTHVPVVDEDECIGCNLCELVCPVEDCITMVERPGDRPEVTWNDYASGKGEILGHK
jgi:dihydropyrimidine dehydrogenase (NAD+) subunit PreA